MDLADPAGRRVTLRGPTIERTGQAAEIIADARRRRAPLPLLDSAVRPKDLSEAHATQRRVHELLAPQCGPLVGYKIGCTSRTMQDYLSFPEPCSGGVFEKGVYASGVHLAFGEYVRVGVECEIALRLGRDCAPSAQPFTGTSIGSAVETVCPAIEIVDDRYAGGWERFDGPTLVADDFFAAGIVLGAPVPARGVDLLHEAGRMLVNGEMVGHGTGADLLGHPFNALAWLANSLASRGEHLKAGQVIMAGSLVRTVWLNRGDRTRAAFATLGSVEVEVR